jgi:hypothetical protein
VPAPGDYDDGEIGGMIGRGNSETTCPNAALSTTNPTCCPEAKPGRRCGKPASNRLSYGTAKSINFISDLRILNQLQPLTEYFLKIKCNNIPPSVLRLSIWYPVVRNSEYSFVCISYVSMPSTDLAHLILLVLVIPMILSEAYKLWSSKLCSLVRPQVPFSLLGPKNPVLCSQIT